MVNRHRSGAQPLLRQINLSAIMHYLRENAPVSRTDLAKLTGLNKTTVSSLIGELIDRRFVSEVGLEESAGVGRRAVLLELNPAAGFMVSCEVGVDFILVVCANFSPKIIWRHEEKIEVGADQHSILERVLVLLIKAMEAGIAKCCDTLLGVAIGVPGLVDQKSGTLLFAPNLKWSNVSLREIFKKQFDDSLLFIDNEANMAALGEHYFGAAQGFDEVLYISAGVGLGGGLILDGQIYRGGSGIGTEFGHMLLVPSQDGLPCNCGKCGCWETLVSQAALFRNIRQLIATGNSSLLEEMVAGDFDRLTVQMVCEAANYGDIVALSAFEQIGKYLGIGIGSLVNAFNPKLVVFGGVLSLAAEFLMPSIEAEMNSCALPWSLEEIQIKVAHHGFDACVMGGIASVYQQVLGQPDEVVRVY